jgi:hypothetical protein
MPVYRFKRHYYITAGTPREAKDEFQDLLNCCAPEISDADYWDQIAVDEDIKDFKVEELMPGNGPLILQLPPKTESNDSSAFEGVLILITLLLSFLLGGAIL